MSESDLRSFVDSVFGEAPDDVRFNRGKVSVAVPGAKRLLTMTSANVRTLRDHRIPAVRGLTLFPHCGYHWDSVAEFLILLENWGQWPENVPLRFRVANVTVHAGNVSNALALLFEPVYRDKDVGQYGFTEYSSIRLEGVSPQTAPRFLNRALFYLNADYLRPLRAAAVVHQLIAPGDDHWGPPPETALKLRRVRVRTRADLRADEPLQLFNDAAGAYGDTQFLGFYRVLEYFFRQALLTRLGLARYDRDVSTDEIVEIARRQGELQQLDSLLRGVLTLSQGRTLADYAYRKGLIARKDTGEIGKAMYEYRNSVVHSKEQEITRVSVPNPLQPNEIAESWVRVARDCAIAAIRRLNTL